MSSFSNEGKERGIDKFFLAASMAIFGTIGIFRKATPVSSTIVAFGRGVIGSLFLGIMMLVTGKKIAVDPIKKAWPWMLASGAMLGINWIMLFEAYRYTTVATATLCYYMAPIFLTIGAALLFKEKIGFKKGICIAVALGGMVLVSGVLKGAFSFQAEGLGVVLGLGAAILYASIIMINKKLSSVPALDRTLFQLGISALVLLPYILLTEDFGASVWTWKAVILLVIMGIVHTGVAYTWYFGAVDRLKAQTVALYSYIDPVLAVILSALFLHESIGIWEVAGAVLILGATMVSEWIGRNQHE